MIPCYIFMRFNAQLEVEIEFEVSLSPLVRVWFGSVWLGVRQFVCAAQVKAHKTHLVARSEYFRSMFRKGAMRESQTSEVLYMRLRGHLSYECDMMCSEFSTVFICTLDNAVWRTI